MAYNGWGIYGLLGVAIALNGWSSYDKVTAVSFGNMLKNYWSSGK